jgi:hypothetical protein
VTPPFNRFYFIDFDADKTDYLRGVCGDSSDVEIHAGDSNDF